MSEFDRGHGPLMLYALIIAIASQYGTIVNDDSVNRQIALLKRKK